MGEIILSNRDFHFGASNQDHYTSTLSPKRMTKWAVEIWFPRETMADSRAPPDH